MISRVGQQPGNYRLLSPLGKGSVAEVYLGEHIYLRIQAAIKVIQTQVTGSDIEGFLNEARAIAQLNHPNIVRLLEFGAEGTTLYLVMEYVPNGTLRQHYPRGTRLLPEIIVPYVKQLAAALQNAHNERLVHRDVKPENLFLGSNNQVLLSDFAIDLATQRSRYQTQEVIGTVAYTAPEQLQGKPRPASDQYSLATVIYEWLSGDCPFHGSFTEVADQQVYAPPPSMRERVPGISLALEQVLFTALSKDPQQRFGSMRAFATAFDQAAGSDQPIRVQPLHESTLIAPVPTIPPPPPPPAFVLPPYSTGPAYQGNSQTPSSPYYPTAPQTFPGQQQPYAPLQPPLAQQQPYAPPQPPPVQQKHQRRGLSAGIMALIVLLILLLIGGSVLIYYAAVLQPSTLHSQATATAQTQATAQIVHAQQTTQTNATRTAQASATAQAVANTHATATAQAVGTATALQNLYNQSTSGSPDLTDPMTSPDANRWEVGTSSTGSGCQFTSGAYHAIIIEKGFFQPCFAEGTDFSNFAYQIQMTIIKGDAGGILFRANNSSFKLYQFSVGQDGSYDLYSYQDRQHSKTLISNSTSPAINKGAGQTNLLTVIARGDHLYLYVNKHYVTSVSDNTTSSGQIGVFAQNYTNPADVAFSNAQVWKL